MDLVLLGELTHRGAGSVVVRKSRDFLGSEPALELFLLSLQRCRSVASRGVPEEFLQVSPLEQEGWNNPVKGVGITSQQVHSSLTVTHSTQTSLPETGQTFITAARTEGCRKPHHPV